MASYSDHTDPELLQLLTRDDAAPAAFDILYERYWEPLYQSAFYLLRDRAAAMDIVQDIFIRLWQRRLELKVEAVGPYLRAAVKFRVANHIRDGRVRDSFFKELRDFQGAGAELNADRQAATRELEAVIREAIQGLPDRCREIFLLSRDERLSNQQIADRLGISVKTVETQMTIALRKIRNRIDTYQLCTILLLALEMVPKK